jgi:hypothetical protein
LACTGLLLSFGLNSQAVFVEIFFNGSSSFVFLG